MESTVHTKAEILKRLQRLAPELRRLGVEKIGLFGSFVRDESHELSDVDILVEFEPGHKSFDSFMHLSFRLEDLFQRHVEVVTKESLSPHIGPQILKETEYVSLPV
ncbi:MAG: nucleotidyltransferase family protein [Rhodothermia bacterium]|nr:MAG: nucleotidyltransferase family protein [Rhodothermia bacterium]